MAYPEIGMISDYKSHLSLQSEIERFSRKISLPPRYCTRGVWDPFQDLGSWDKNPFMADLDRVPLSTRDWSGALGLRLLVNVLKHQD
jgi:hypothetical protein